MTQQLRILTGYGKPKSIGLSFLKSHPPAICWLSSKPTLRRSDRKEQHMNNIRNALRYIYIYILTHATAGWAYDRQPREVWERRKPKANSSYLYSHWRHRLWSEVFFEWRAGFIHNGIYNPIDHNFDRCGDYVFHRILRRYNAPRCRCFDANYLYIWAGERLFLSTSLTPKEVAA